MKFIVSSEKLLKELQILGGIINNTNTLPILNNFLFHLNNNQLILSASDLETSMSSSIDVESSDKGMVAIPAKLILDTLKTFPDQPLTFIKSDQNTIEISANSGKYSLAYFDGEEFPKPIQVKDPVNTKISGNLLGKAIDSTLFASGNDDLRPIMSGVFFQFYDNEIIFVATDAHKLVKYKRLIESKTIEKTEFIVPKKPLQLLRGILQDVEKDVTIEFNENNAVFLFKNYSLNCRLIDGKYPNYEAVIPKENPNVLKINRLSLLNSIKRVSIFSNKTTHQIKLKMAGTELHLSAEDIDFSNKAEERLDCDYKGDDMEIGFNSRFILEMLNNIDCDEINLSMSLPNKAGIISPIDNEDKAEDITMLVMPVMLNE